MITALGVRVVVSGAAAEIHPEELEAALRGSSEPTVIKLADITSADIHSGDSWDESTVAIASGGDTVTVRFAPGDTEGPQQLCALLAGETASADKITDFCFVAVTVHTANQDWGSVDRVELARVIDGEITERLTLDSPTQEALADFIGDNPIVGYNGYFDASALRYAGLVTDLSFACVLTQARAAELGVTNHKLDSLASFFGVDADPASVMTALARHAKHAGSLEDFIHSRAFAMGTVNAQRVIPVLRDFSGAASSMQKASKAEKEKPKVEQQSNSRGPAPWQSVATPDTVPDPAVDADPNSPLYGHNVTLTGEFDPFDKGQLWDGIADQGAQVGKNVTKKTTILVTGEWATMTSKEKRARELMDKGQEIDIWPAEKLLHVLGLDEEPPF
nr:DNA polymerase III subunit epsilon [Streptococcus thermophilus]